ncbi:MAG: SMR family transporter [Caldilinea sp.]|nr:hypothetical protein [Caldilinea sp.]MCB0038243.1 hypothetical protein [Caldilinea sp.]MCB9125441.1 small multidrug resistance protein [Caldilineaceae bacterium]MCO5212746.1 SMR family transporter [Caldilinea sp.]HRW49315.1 SMR family transporter [Caldilinea sp.]
MINIALLLVAAVSYSVGGYFMKLSDGLTRGGPSLIVLALFGLGASLQMVAMRQREMTSTYIIVLGIEAITALLLGMALLNESLTPIKIGGIILIAAGMLALHS